jgi:hypothetical protein
MAYQRFTMHLRPTQVDTIQCSGTNMLVSFAEILLVQSAN